MYDLLYRHDGDAYRSRRLLEKYKKENIALKKELALLQNVRHHHKELGENQK